MPQQQRRRSAVGFKARAVGGGLFGGGAFFFIEVNPQTFLNAKIARRPDIGTGKAEHQVDLRTPVAEAFEPYFLPP